MRHLSTLNSLVLIHLSLSLVFVSAEELRPNILWITSEDNGPQLGIYGDTYADTPNLDAFGKRSLRFHRCWSNAPVCAPARTTIISGMYATSLGAHHMRSGVTLPPDMKLYPQVLGQAGYFCTNHSKTDYNFANDNAGWKKAKENPPWRSRPSDTTPFMSVINFTTSHESQIRTRPHTLSHDPSKAPLPSYHPDTPEVRHDWAQYYDKVTQMDAQVGKVLADLEADGLADSTIIFYYGDHGSGMPRSKRWPFDSGLRVPLMIHVPNKFLSLAPEGYAEGAVSKQLVSFVDLAPTVISLAGVKPPANMQGVAFAGQFSGQPRSYLIGYRGRMDERIDMVRSCTDGRYVYMRHFYPDRPYLKHVDYMFQTPTTRVWKKLFDEGKLNLEQAKFWGTKPVEELFDLENDPDEVNNLAASPEYAQTTAEFREVILDFMAETADMGMFPEAEMHRVVMSDNAKDVSPREYGLNHPELMKRVADVSMKASDPASEMSLEDAIELSKDKVPVIRFWGARGIFLRTPQNEQSINALRSAANDESPSVSVAACEGLLNHGSDEDKNMATKRLIELSDAKEFGHFAAIEALNVLDSGRAIDDSVRKRIVELPKKTKNPPVRADGYVGRLIETVKEGL